MASLTYHGTKSPLIHCGFDAFVNQVNAVGGGATLKPNNPIKSVLYEKLINSLASRTFGSGFILMAEGPTSFILQSKFIVSPGSIMAAADDAPMSVRLKFMFPSKCRAMKRQCHDTFLILNKWLLLVMLNGNMKGFCGSDAETEIVAPVS